LKLEYDEPLSKFAFDFNLRRYNKTEPDKSFSMNDIAGIEVRRCTFTPASP